MLKDFDKFIEACENNVVTLVAREYNTSNEPINVLVTSDVELAGAGVYVLGEIPMNHTNNVFVWRHDDGSGRQLSMQAIDWSIAS